MSLRAMVWAFGVIRSGCVKKDSAKLVLLKLGDRANDDNVAWPGRERLGDDVGLSEPTVRGATHELERAGLIKIERRKDGAGRDLSHIYHLLVPLSLGEGKDSYPRGKESFPRGQESYPGGLNAYPESINSNHPREAAARAAPPPPQQHAAALVSTSTPTLRRRRGDQKILHGVVVWTDQDEAGVVALVKKHGVQEVEEVAARLRPPPGVLAPYLSAVVGVFQEREARAARDAAVFTAAAATAAAPPLLDAEIVRTRMARARAAALGEVAL